MKYYRRCENHFYLFNIPFSVDCGKARGLSKKKKKKKRTRKEHMAYEKNKKNYLENQEDCKAISILVVKDDFYKF